MDSTKKAPGCYHATFVDVTVCASSRCKGGAKPVLWTRRVCGGDFLAASVFFSVGLLWKAGYLYV
jgi:hypothetical protein